MTGSKLHKSTATALNHIYGITSDIAERNEGKTGVAAGTAASLLSMGIDKLNRSQLSSAEIEELSAIGDMGPPSGNSEDKQDHFIDRLLEKLLIHNIPSDSIERESIEMKLNDTARAQKPRLSITVLTSNFRKLSARMDGLFQIQYGLIRILTWKKPTVTLMYALLYTSICLYPHLMLVYPLVFLLGVIMIPGYSYRHPLPKPDIRPVKKRGQSLLEFFSESNGHDVSILNQFINAEDLPEDPDFSPISTAKSENLNLDSVKSNTSGTELKKGAVKRSSTENTDSNHKNTKVIKSKIELMINMRDLQNLTTDVINLYDTSEKFWFETAGFKDERTSTSLFFSVLLSALFLLTFGAYTPWRLIFILGGWGLIIACHPSSSQFIQKFNKNFIEPREKEMAKKMQRSEREDILLDEPPATEEVEIFELQQRGLTSNTWEPYYFTTTIFDKNDSIRLCQKNPIGTDKLAEVLPPMGWSFEVDSDDSWSIDYNGKKIIEDRGLSNVLVDENNEWIYDEVEPRSSHSLEFRRRRWVRNCYRYSRPARKPKSHHLFRS